MVSQVEAPSVGLDALPARPPTPPRERQSELDLKLNLTRHPLASRLTLQTPPSHSPDSINTSSRRSGKRVEFTIQAEYRDPPTINGKGNEYKQSTPVAAPSSIGTSKPLKSILKPTSSPIPPNPLGLSAGPGQVGGTTNLAAMLESTIKHLASSDRDSKVDAYTMLVRALKASTNLPDRIALQSKMSLFMQFIQRDITAKSGNGTMDSSLVNHALTLLSTFLHFPAIASAVTPDFGVFIIDHCIRSFEDHLTPKDVVRHLMQVVVFQDFPSKVMTSDRVGRLVTALHNIENYITGKSIVMSRILIYRRLIKQCTIHMVSHSEWLLDLFTDMLSSMKEIRSAAIALGLEASFTVAKEKQLPKKVMEILQMTADETRYVEYYVQRLTAMTKEKSDMAAVPQIWSVVILLLRCPIDRWEFFDQWLEIIQRCFNSGDYQTKVEANYAWNRLVYALHLHESSFSKTIGTLCQPFNQLRRRGKQTDELRKVVIGGLCNLYYYAFKPNSSSAHVDQYWDACVRTLIRTLAFPEADLKSVEKIQVPSSDNLSQAANILSGLFNSSSVRLWKEDRIAESTLAKPDDLPALDPKWIRRNATRVFSTVEPILYRSFSELADPSSSASKLWRSLIGAVATAASKEVKVSTDTAAFLGHALSLLMRIWTVGLGEATASADMEQKFLKATEAYLTIMVLSIGHLPFTEKLLSMNKQNTLVPIATPSHRSGKGYGPTRSALHHLFSMLSLSPPGISDGEDLSILIKAVFEPFMLTRSPRSKRDLVQEFMQVLPSEGPINYGSWVFIAELLSTSGEQSQSSYSSADSTSQPPIGHEFREIVKQLEKGISCTPNLPWYQWSSLFNFVVGQATELTGEAGCSIAVVEPLAKAILESSALDANSINSNLINCGSQLICSARQPRDRQALDAARRRLWGITVGGARSASFDPFENLYRLTSRLLAESYTAVDKIDEHIVASLITETSHFLSRSNQVLVFKSLVQLQQGLGLWIQDVDQRYGSKQRSTISMAVKLLWDRICSLFDDTTLENFQLDAIDQLLCCAFKSKHRHIVNGAVLLWNQGFENASEIQYPEALKDVLLSLRSYVDIALPGLDVASCDSHDLVPMFVDSQDDLGFMDSSGRPGQRMSPRLNGASSSRRLETPRSGQILLTSLDKSEGPRTRSRPRSTRATRSAQRRALKLRHDDSQVQFAHIESSPSNQSIESQVLTDRQKEVRERQLENASLFPSIRSSPRKNKGMQGPSSSQASPQQFGTSKQPVVDQAATPKATRSYDYVSSTPTPRRGQPSMVYEDHEMTDDIPSSPPEPRRNLLPEMKSHARDTSILDDMPISSSPVSRSPVSRSPVPMMPLEPQDEQLASQEGTISIVMESMSSQHTSLDVHNSIAVLSPGLPKVSNQEPAQNVSVNEPIIQRSETPTNNHPPKARETVQSDNEVFVDALTSLVSQELPTLNNAVLPVNPTQDDSTVFKDRSFEMSDGEERSMARLIIELDSRKCDPIPNYDASSPVKAPGDEHTTECITVHGDSGRDQRISAKSQSTQLSSQNSSTSAETDNSQASEKRTKKKRKRVTDKKENSGGKKRKHEDGDTVMDSQPQPVNHEELPLVSDTEPGETGGNNEVQEHVNQPSLTHMQGSPDLAYDPGNDRPIEPLDLDEDLSMDADTVAVNLQLITEASQQSQVELHTDFTDDDASESPIHSQVPVMAQEDAGMVSEPVDRTDNGAVSPVGQSAIESITASLRDGLQALQTATLSREEVYKIEDMFIDIKKELYEAVRRSRR